MKLLRNITFTIVICILIFSVTILLNRNYDSLLEEQIKQQKNAFSIASKEFEAKMNNSIIFVYGLSGFTYSQLDEGLTKSNFEEFANKTQSHVPFIKNFSVAIDYIQTYVYPIKGNESTLGHNLMTDSRKEVVDDVNAAMSSGRLIISGPYELRQGGLGMVVRSPIVDETNPNMLVNVVIDVEAIIESSEISSSESNDYQLSSDNDIFWGKTFIANHTSEILVGNDIWVVGSYIHQELNRPNLIRFIRESVIIILLSLILIGFIVSVFRRNRKLSTRVYSLVYDDILTGLPNRRALEERISKLISKNKDLSIAFLDLDNFKDINDTLGHSYGDRVLKEIAGRFTDHNVLEPYRWGGDEFVLLGTIDVTEFLEHLKDLQALVSKPIELQKEEYIITSSAGICSYPLDANTSEELIKLADTTMYYVKQRGKNSLKLYNTEIGETILAEMRIERLIDSALKQGLFELHYQPQYNLKEEKITGFEALIRMKDENGNFVSPAKFIPIAEKSHLIYLIDEYVVDRALNDLSQWHKLGHDFSVAINISAKHFSKSFADYINNRLQLYSINPTNVEIEITESVAIEDFENAELFLLELSKLGVQVALDDFGTGYSSLSYISKLHLSTLKIDRSFITKMTYGNNEYSIIKSVVEIVKALNIKSIAEGVETKLQLELIDDLNCDAYQGYYLSKPLHKEDVIDFYQKNQS